MEMICAIMCQLTKNLRMKEMKQSGFDAYDVGYTMGLWL